MQIDQITEDFLDYRAYVSHTLCQHNFFLGLNSPAIAREWLTDAAGCGRWYMMKQSAFATWQEHSTES